MSGTFKGKSLLVPLVISGLGVMTVASAQTVSSPFAKKTKKQAWETDVVAPPASPAPVPAAPSAPYSPPPSTGYSAPKIPTQYNAPASNPLQESARRQIQGSPYAVSYTHLTLPTTPYV